MDRHNGWTNHETWCVYLWLTNHERSVSQWEAEAKEVWDAAEADEPFTRLEVARINLAEQLKDWHLDGFENLRLPGLWQDLLCASLDEVNWDEIARALLGRPGLQRYRRVHTED